MDEREIRSLFQTHSVLLGAKDVWAVQGVPVIKHAALERLSAALKLVWDMPVIVRAERDECVVLARATRQDGIAEWSFGEALIVKEGQAGGNYKVSGKQASYVFAMSEKRAKDRVIIKLAGLHGAYSEDESDDFRQGRQDPTEERQQATPPVTPIQPEAKSTDLTRLISMGDEASSRGTETLTTWGKSLTKDERTALGPERIATWKREAAEIDRISRTDPALGAAA